MTVVKCEKFGADKVTKFSPTDDSCHVYNIVKYKEKSTKFCHAKLDTGAHGPHLRKKANVVTK